MSVVSSRVLVKHNFIIIKGEVYPCASRDTEKHWNKIQDRLQKKPKSLHKIKQTAIK